MLIVSVTLMFVDLPVLDPILSVAITAYILFNVVRHLKQTLLLFLQAVPDDIDLSELERRLGALEHVLSTHHTHVWSMDGAHHVSLPTLSSTARQPGKRWLKFVLMWLDSAMSIASPTRRSKSNGVTTSVAWGATDGNLTRRSRESPPRRTPDLVECL